MDIFTGKVKERNLLTHPEEGGRKTRKIQVLISYRRKEDTRPRILPRQFQVGTWNKDGNLVYCNLSNTTAKQLDETPLKELDDAIFSLCSVEEGSEVTLRTNEKNRPHITPFEIFKPDALHTKDMSSVGKALKEAAEQKKFADKMLASEAAEKTEED